MRFINFEREELKRIAREEWPLAVTRACRRRTADAEPAKAPIGAATAWAVRRFRSLSL